MRLSYDALFDCVRNFLARLHIYTEHIPLVPTMSDILVKIMAETYRGGQANQTGSFKKK